MRLRSRRDEAEERWRRRAASRGATSRGGGRARSGAGERREKQNGGVRGDVLRRAKLPNRAFGVVFFLAQKGRLRGQ